MQVSLLRSCLFCRASATVGYAMEDDCVFYSRHCKPLVTTELAAMLLDRDKNARGRFSRSFAQSIICSAGNLLLVH